ncbi:uncharacterized protein LOC124594095 [Schistocerca americana]|uniref:uncharacterized protein LOC124594095 n=1 Tax=Schistocerca americana TaxID=7009 RepID=UPI001F4FECE2|nr:uncharacterized protein LOC124594095 [Schistocerca americana]
MNCSEQERLEKRVRYYHCHRSFNFNSKGTGARRVKSMGTNKIGSTCPSNMQVTITEDKCCLKFFPKHMGHTQDVGRTFLHGNERAELAGRLSQGVPVGRVLQDVRSAPIAASVERIHLLEKKDLHNIKRDFDIGYATKKHENDAVSVKLWVEEMKRQSDNPVLYFKQQKQVDPNFQDEDFILIIMTDFQDEQLLKYGEDKICVDGSHGMTAYDFQLFTIVVVDRYGAGMPVAFCFSNRGDMCLLSFYFKCVRERVGTVKTNVFMSDDAPAFYNAWSAESEQCSLPSSADNEYVSALLSGNSEKSADTFEQDVMSHCETIVALSKGTQCGQETKAKVLKDLKKIIAIDDGAEENGFKGCEHEGSFFNNCASAIDDGAEENGFKGCEHEGSFFNNCASAIDHGAEENGFKGCEHELQTLVEKFSGSEGYVNISDALFTESASTSITEVEQELQQEGHQE